MNAASSLPSLGALTAEERGFVLGALALGLDAECLAEPSPGRCRAVLDAAATLPAAEKAALLARLAQAARSTPFAPGAAEVHPSWWQQVLDGEPSELIPALAAGAPPAARLAAAAVLRGRGVAPEAAGAAVPADLAADLQRVVFDDLLALVSPPAVAPGTRAAWWLGRDAAALAEALRLAGARALGTSVAGAAREVIARAMAGVGSRWAEEVRAAATTPGDRRQALEDVAAVQAELSTAAGAVSIEERLERIGARAVARELAGESGEVRAALALRLPAAAGRRLL